MNIKKLSTQELYQLRHDISSELNRRHQTPEKAIRLGDGDGDVLWKHHGVSEVEAAEMESDMQ